MTSDSRERLLRRAAWIGAITFAVLFALEALRLALGKVYSIDELTYAHASWAIAHGQLPFRDYFFHHTPLLAQLGAAVFAIGGDDPQNILYLRALMLPFVALIAVSAVLLNRERCGRWAIATVAVMLACAVFATHATEFRHDPLAFALWLASLAVLGSRRLAPRQRAFAAGALVIAAVWASEKVLLYGCVTAIAWVIDVARNRRRAGTPLLLGDPAWFLLGAAAALLPIAGYLTATGSWAAFYTWGLKFPLVHERSYPGFPWTRHFGPFWDQAWWLFPFGAIGVVDTVQRRGRSLWGHVDLLLLAALPTTFASFAIPKAAYPYSLVPFVGLLAIFVCRGLVVVYERAATWPTTRGRIGVTVGATAIVTFALVAALVTLERRQRDGNDHQHAMLARLGEVLAPDDPVYDNSGSSVTHPHVSFYFFTDMTIRSSQPEMLARDMPAAILAHQCTAFLPDIRTTTLPDELTRFLFDNFKPYTGDIWLWGRGYPNPAHSAVVGEFIAVRTARYFVEPAAALTNGRLEIDGARIESPVFELTRGTHHVRYQGTAPGFFLLWLPRNGEPYRPAIGAKPTFSTLF